MKNCVTSFIQSHRSIRKFTQQPISDQILKEVIRSAQYAPTSHYVQAYSIIVVKEQDLKNKLANVSGSQKYVESCPVFLVFCADFYRLKLTSELYPNKFEIDEVENLIVGSVDTALAAQNAYITARSYGLGGVMIGAIRNQPKEVASLLQLPKLVIPIMGLCLGYPAEDPFQKPRLPMQVIAHSESYQKDQMIKELKEYNSITAQYYIDRTNGERTEGWIQKMSSYLSEPRRKELKKFIIDQGIKLT